MRQGTMFDAQIRQALTTEPQTAQETAAKCGLPLDLVREILWGHLSGVSSIYDREIHLPLYRLEAQHADDNTGPGTGGTGGGIGDGGILCVSAERTPQSD